MGKSGMNFQATPYTAQRKSASTKGRQANKTIEDESSVDSKSDSQTAFGLKRHVGLIAAISLNVTQMIGSGIYISPKGVLSGTGSVGLSLVVWALCGVISMFGCLAYAELGTFIGKSGANFPTFREAFGEGVAFAYGFLGTVLGGVGASVVLLTSAEYIATNLFVDECPGVPSVIKSAIASLLAVSIAGLNIFTMASARKLNVVMTVVKILSLTFISVVGVVQLFKGHTENFKNSFEGTSSSPGEISLAVFSGMWPYAGWNSANTLVEEVINPNRNIPLAAVCSVTVVTILYLLTNISYFVMLSPKELLASHAVALSWANSIFPSVAWIITVIVFLSTFGTSHSGVMSNSRSNYRKAREGHLPSIFAMVNVDRCVPIAPIILNLMQKLLYIWVTDLPGLINFLGFTNWTVIGLSMIALYILRYKYRDRPRPFKCPLVIPGIMLLFAIFFVVAPLVDKPRLEYLIGIGLYFASIFFYVPFVYYKKKIPGMDSFTKTIQLLLEIAPCETDDDELMAKRASAKN